MSCLITAPSLSALHATLFPHGRVGPIDQIAHLWLYILSQGTSHPPEVNSRFYLPYPGWQVHTTDSTGAVTLMSCGSTKISPQAYGTLVSVVQSGKCLVLAAGTDKVYLPKWEPNSAKNGGVLLTSTFSVRDITPDRIHFAVCFLQWLDRRLTSDFLRHITSLGAAGWGVMRAVGSANGLTRVIAALDSTEDNLVTRLHRIREEEELSSTVGGLISAITVSLSQGMTQTQRWREFMALRRVTPQRQYQALIAEQLQLHLPVSMNAAKSLVFEDASAWQPKSLDMVGPNELVPLGSKPSAGNQILDFLARPPVSFYVLQSANTVLYRLQPERRKGDRPRLVQAGTVEEIGLPTIHGELLATVLAPIIETSSAPVVASSVPPPVDDGLDLFTL